jgi:hypothetical protein
MNRAGKYLFTYNYLIAANPIRRIRFFVDTITSIVPAF